MSREYAREFINRVERDQKFRHAAMEASEPMITFAKEQGFDFTREELYREMQQRWGAAKEFWRGEPMHGEELFCCLSKPPAF